MSAGRSGVVRRRRSMIATAGLVWTLGALGLLGIAQAQQEAGVDHFYFYWPAITRQCQTIDLTWQNATPPFSFWILPMGGSPFMYKIPDSAYSNGQGSYPIQLQLNYGTNYITMMSDAYGIGSGGTGEIQQAGSSPNTGCLNTVSQNATQTDFSFTVAGVAEQCESGFEVAWTGGDALDPVNFTVLPLDQGFFPFDVRMDNSATYINTWTMNLTEGTRFTIMMNDKNGYGRGGIAGIYEVDSSNSSECVATQTQVSSETGSWPVGIATNTLPVATRPPDNQRRGGGITGGAIAGIVIGLLALLGLVIGVVWWLMRRKRAREAAAAKTKDEGEELDLAGESTDYSNPAPDPYRDLGAYVGQPNGQGSGLGEGSRSGSFNSWNEQNHLLLQDAAGSAAASTAGFAGLGAGSRGPSVDHARQSGEGEGRGQYVDPYAPQFPGSRAEDILGEGERRTGPGVAGPLPRKSSPGVPGLPAGAGVGTGGFVVRNHTSSTTTASGGDLSSGKATQGHSHSPAAGFGPAPHGPQGGLRIANPNPNEHDQPSPHSAAIAPAAPSPRRIPPRETQPRFRRHEDAGRVPLPGDEVEEDVVDLPPLYSDVPRDREPVMRGPDAGEGGGESGRNVGTGGYR